MADVMWAKENLPCLEIVNNGEELHYAQESNPVLMGETISAWLQGLEQGDNMKTFNIAIAGATGAVGAMVLSILEERKFPINQLYLLASKKSAGEIIDFGGKSLLVEDLAVFDFSQTEICFFCTSNEISAEYAPKAAAKKNIVIDKSSFFRYDIDVPLIVPEVNIETLDLIEKRRIIANPNCSTIPLAVALKPIQDTVGIERIEVVTYQSVSGSGKDGVTELADQTAALMNGRPIKPHIYSEQIAFNILPCIDSFQENGYTKEEMKIIWELSKILDDEIPINATAVRVPVFYGHSAAVHVKTKKKLSAKKAADLLKKAPGVKVDDGKHPYCTPVKAAGKDAVYVGRIREDISQPHGLNLWVVTDNLRKGAALNAVQIAECLLEKYF